MTIPTTAPGSPGGSPVVEHKTRTWERRDGDRYRTKSNGSCGRYVGTYTYGWICSCGARAITGSTRDEARRDARWHRDDPDGHPGNASSGR